MFKKQKQNKTRNKLNDQEAVLDLWKYCTWYSALKVNQVSF